MTLPTVIPSWGLVIHNPATSDPAVVQMRGAVTFGNALLAAHRDAGSLYFTDSRIQALEPQTGCDSVVPAALALDGPTFDLHCLRRYCHHSFNTALRHVVFVIALKFRLFHLIQTSQLITAASHIR